MKEWESVIEVFEALKKMWASQNLRINLGDPIEIIAKEKIHFVSSISALEGFFKQMQEDILSLQEEEKEQPKVRKLKNPFRD